MDMKLCSNCGTPIGEDFKVCPNCGDPVSGNSRKRASDDLSMSVSEAQSGDTDIFKYVGAGLFVVGIFLIISGMNYGLACILFGILGFCLGIGKKTFRCPVCESEVSFINHASISKVAHCNACHADIPLRWN